MLIGILFSVLLLVYIAWLFIRYCTLIISNKKAYKAFFALHEQINKRYGILLSKLDSYNENEKLVSETKGFINKAVQFSYQKEGVDRIIRFANAIFDNAKQLGLTVNEDTEFNNAKFHYNKCAQKLKYYVDVFPTSLMARLAHIQFLDSLK